MNSCNVLDNIHFQGEIRDDDEFFHITCHVEPGLIERIAKGEFVDLEKLLPKSRNAYINGNNEPKTELIFKEGKPIFVPHVDRNRVVNGVRKWEQAFRIYAVIYSQANPTRSAEIWQYVFTINAAAALYAWNNIAEYDFAFRQMMAKNPRRSWSKIYTQMWIICLTETVHNRNFKQNYSTNGSYHGGKPAGGNQSISNNGKPSYCWKYNKTGKCQFGNNCKLVNRCSYCDGVGHGLYNCSRKLGEQGQQSAGSEPQQH